MHVALCFASKSGIAAAKEKFNDKVSICEADIGERITMYARDPIQIPIVGTENHPAIFHCKRHAKNDEIRTLNTKANTHIDSLHRETQ